MVAYWKQLADPDGAEHDDEERRGRRDVYLEQSFGGMWLGKITLDPISGAIVGGELERLEQQMFEADWAAAKERLGFDPAASSVVFLTTVTDCVGYFSFLSLATLFLLHH